MQDDQTIADFNHQEDDSNLFESQITAAKIMLVDDEPINTDVLQSYLEGEGYTNFVTTTDSRLAIDTMHEEKPDVILLDLMMPNVSGFDILRTMRQDEKLKHIPVVILTSSDDAETKLKALQYGAMDFLAKPVDASELALRLRNTLAAKAYQYQQINFDQLTGLPKRDAFLDSSENATLKLISEEKKGAALHIYIENLKNINSTIGRSNGNKIIKTFSRRLAACVNDACSIQSAFDRTTGSYIARTAGDKFTVFLGPIESKQQVEALARKIIEDTHQQIEIDGRNILVSVKVGVAMFPEDGKDIHTLVSSAETAMTHIRDRSDSYIFYALSMDEEAARILAVETGLQTAIQKGELKVVYQPKVDIVSGKIIGAEALIRWISPELGFVGPDLFISIAERTGQIVEIGEFILKEAAKQAAIWRNQFGFDFRIAVNMSIRQIHDSDMTKTAGDALKESGLPPHCLVLELTENMVMENAESNVELLKNLKSLGLSLSIDDFGTGYSSLSYLQTFPLDELKIDRSFVMEITSENQKTPIIRAMVSLAHDLDMKVVAEGVESDLQLRHMAKLDCEMYQGYLRSKPVVPNAFEDLLLVDYPGKKAA